MAGSVEKRSIIEQARLRSACRGVTGRGRSTSASGPECLIGEQVDQRKTAAALPGGSRGVAHSGGGDGDLHTVALMHGLQIQHYPTHRDRRVRRIWPWLRSMQRDGRGDSVAETGPRPGLHFSRKSRELLGGASPITTQAGPVARPAVGAARGGVRKQVGDRGQKAYWCSPFYGVGAGGSSLRTTLMNPVSVPFVSY